jgi:hypothetical protein
MLERTHYDEGKIVKLNENLQFTTENIKGNAISLGFTQNADTKMSTNSFVLKVKNFQKDSVY